MPDAVDEDPSRTVGDLLARLGVAASLAQPDQLPHNRRLTPGVWQVRSPQGRRMVLKYLRADRDPGDSAWDRHWTADDHDPQRWNYWAREPLAYQQHLTDVYASAGIIAPVCHGCLIDEHEAVLLLDWVDGRPGEEWPVDAYGAAAEALGRAQALLARPRPVAAEGWLSRRFLREYSSEKPVEWSLLDDDEAWQHPQVRALFPPGLRDDLRFVHTNRERLYRICESLPQTLCHLDLWPKNLFRRTDDSFVLIDWAFVGQGAIGEDIGNLIPDACFDHFVPVEQLPDLERVVFNGYLRGLRDAGCNADPDHVRLAMWSSSVKYDWLGPFMLARARETRHYRYGGKDEIDGAFMLRERGRALQFNARWARQALDLASRLGF